MIFTDVVLYIFLYFLVNWEGCPLFCDGRCDHLMYTGMIASRINYHHQNQRHLDRPDSKIRGRPRWFPNTQGRRWKLERTSRPNFASFNDITIIIIFMMTIIIIIVIIIIPQYSRSSLKARAHISSCFCIIVIIIFITNIIIIIIIIIIINIIIMTWMCSLPVR